ALLRDTRTCCADLTVHRTSPIEFSMVPTLPDLENTFCSGDMRVRISRQYHDFQDYLPSAIRFVGQREQHFQFLALAKFVANRTIRALYATTAALIAFTIDTKSPALGASRPPTRDHGLPIRSAALR